MNFKKFLATATKRVNLALLNHLPSQKTTPQKLHRAMHYAIFSGGKRLRPTLVYATGKTFGAPLAALDTIACAVELMHTFSLIHDDLPCIDNDNFRRGKPSCHHAFNEATALLAGDALQLLAIEILCDCSKLTTTNKSKLIKVLTKNCGSLGLIGGESMDVELAQNNCTKKTLPPTTSALIKQTEKIYLLKTSSLIQACVTMGALAATPNKTQLTMLDQYAKCIGLAFQIQDDILEFEEFSQLKKTKTNNNTNTKDKDQDGANNNKNIAINHQQTYLSLIGIDQAKNKITTLYQQAQQALTALARTKYKNINGHINYINTDLLQNLTDYIMQRRY